MSISGILSSAASASYQHQFRPLNPALQADNVKNAPSPFAALQPTLSKPAEAFKKLEADLRSGDLSAAQKDFSTLRQDIQSQSGNHLHRSPNLGGENGSAAIQNALLQDLSQDGQASASSNRASAQQAYATLQQQLQQFAFGGGSLSSRAGALQDQPPLSLVA